MFRILCQPKVLLIADRELVQDSLMLLVDQEEDMEEVVVVVIHGNFASLIAGSTRPPMTHLLSLPTHR